jgi:hypothetical protein
MSREPPFLNLWINKSSINKCSINKCSINKTSNKMFSKVYKDKSMYYYNNQISIIIINNNDRMHDMHRKNE